MKLEYIFNIFKIWVIVQPWENGLRVRGGKRIKKLNKGIYFRIPYYDSIYIQETRLRVISMSIQTLTSKDGKTITLNGAIGYSIIDLEKLYEKLFRPEITISNLVMSKVATFIQEINIQEITPSKIEDYIISELKFDDYGINLEYFKLTNFAIVKTFRLIQDKTWFDDGLILEDKK